MKGRLDARFGDFGGLSRLQCCGGRYSFTVRSELVPSAGCYTTNLDRAGSDKVISA